MFLWGSCRSIFFSFYLLSLLSFFIWPLYCLPFVDLRLSLPPYPFWYLQTFLKNYHCATYYRETGFLNDFLNYNTLYFTFNLKWFCLNSLLNYPIFTDNLFFNFYLGINTVLKSLKLNPGDVLLCTDNSYQAIKYA